MSTTRRKTRDRMIGLRGLSIAVLGVTVIDASFVIAREATKWPVGDLGPPVEDFVLNEVSADQLVCLPFARPGKVYFPDGHADYRNDHRRDGEMLIYSSTLGTAGSEVFVYRPGRVARIADDLVTEAVSDCPLTGLRVMVNGGVAEDEGDTFSVRVNLYDNCPSSGATQVFPPRVDPDRETYVTFSGLNAFEEEFPILDLGPILADLGTCVDMPDAPPCSVSAQDCETGSCQHDPPEIPPTVWLRLRFSTETAGVVVGTPPEIGFSADAFDYYRSPTVHSCRAWFNGFPLFPHASFWIQLHSTADCPRHFLAYRAVDPEQPPFIPEGGPTVRVADDLRLAVDNCEVSAYELGIIGNAGPYEMQIDLRWPGIVDVIQGTQNVFVGRGEGSLEIARFEVPPGATLNINDQPIWITWQPNRAATGVPVALNTQLGESMPWFAMEHFPGYPPGVWDVFTLSDDKPAIFYASIFCRAEPPLGACCVGEQLDTPNAEPLCFDNVPATACIEGRWLADFTCAQNPFVPPCGAQACCLPSDDCADLPRDECLSHCEPNLDPIACATDDDCPGPQTCGGHQCHDGVEFTGEECNPAAGGAACPSGEICALFDPTICTPKCARWYNRTFCDDPDMSCPIFACFNAVGDCYQGEPSFACVDHADCPNEAACDAESNTCSQRVGCNRLLCCNAVCQREPFCCEVAWDNECVVWASIFEECDVSPGNDECFGPYPDDGAFPIVLVDDDTGGPCTPAGSASCSGSMPAINVNATVVPGDPGFCCNNLGVNRLGAGTIWYKFTAAHETARVHTCDTPGSATAANSLLQVFRPQSSLDEETACATLEVIGCNDDYTGCGEEANSSICVTGLTPGDVYYVLLASSSALYRGPYRISIESPCPSWTLPGENNWCETALAVGDGVLPFDLEDAVFDCPAEPELPTMTNDLWWRYTAPCTGLLTVETCDPMGQGDSPPTNLAVYEGFTCPPDSLAAASDDAAGDCAPASSVRLPVFVGEEFTIRLGGERGGEPAGFLSITCEIDDCNGNALPDLWEIQTGIALDCNQNAEPDECDINPIDPDENGLVSEDCDANEVPDECQIDFNSDIDCTVHGPAPCCEGPFFCLSDCDYDVNENGIPDACDDFDEDGVPNTQDNCPADPNPGQEDCNNDGEGDACEADAADRDEDGDGICNRVDNCPAAANSDQKDKDQDGLGDVCDPCPKVAGPCFQPRPIDAKGRPLGRN